MNYKDILKDPRIIDKFKIIDLQNNNRANHGLNHALNVSQIMIKLIDVLNISQQEKDYLLIACVLHDIGQVNGSDNHNISSKSFISEYLKNKVDDEWLQRILLAIEKHHQKEEIETLSLFEHLVLFADKMDFSYKRLDENYIKNSKEYFLEKYILDVNFKIENNAFIVVIIVDKNITEKDFEQFEYYPKILKRVEQFASKLNLNYKIEIKNF